MISKNRHDACFIVNLVNLQLMRKKVLFGILAITILATIGIECYVRSIENQTETATQPIPVQNSEVVTLEGNATVAFPVRN